MMLECHNNLSGNPLSIATLREVAETKVFVLDDQNLLWLFKLSNYEEPYTSYLYGNRQFVLSSE